MAAIFDLSNELKTTYYSKDDILKLIDQLAEKKDLSKNDIAEALGISKQSYYSLRNKKTLNFDDVKRIVDALGFEMVIELKEKERFHETISNTKITNNASKKRIRRIGVRQLKALRSQAINNNDEELTSLFDQIADNLQQEYNERNLTEEEIYKQKILLIQGRKGTGKSQYLFDRIKDLQKNIDDLKEFADSLDDEQLDEVNTEE